MLTPESKRQLSQLAAGGPIPMGKMSPARAERWRQIVAAERAIEPGELDRQAERDVRRWEEVNFPIRAAAKRTLEELDDLGMELDAMEIRQIARDRGIRPTPSR